MRKSVHIGSTCVFTYHARSPPIHRRHQRKTPIEAMQISHPLLHYYSTLLTEYCNKVFLHEKKSGTKQVLSSYIQANQISFSGANKKNECKFQVRSTQKEEVFYRQFLLHTLFVSWNIYVCESLFFKQLKQGCLLDGSKDWTLMFGISIFKRSSF